MTRGAAASTIAVLIAAVSHTIGGGAAPHPLLVLSLSVLLTPVAALIVGGAPRAWRTAAAVAVAQLVFHVIFVALNATAGATVVGHQHTLSLDALPASSPADAGMLGAHVAAAALTWALLQHGERMLRAVARWVRATLRTAPALPRLAAPAPVPWPVLALRAPRTVLLGDLSRRGPPQPA